MFTIPDQEILARNISKTLHDASLVVGELYKMRCKTTGKEYVGQTVSHAKNRSKYRPTGHQRRSNAHFSEAKHDKRGFQCTYLNNAIRKYGEEDFEIELIMRCPKEDMDAWEMHWIDKLGTLAPDGYNLTMGGKCIVKDTVKAEYTDKVFVKSARNAPRPPEVNAKVSASSRAYYATPEGHKSMSDRVRKTHLEKNLIKYQDMDIPSCDEQTVRVITSKAGLKYGAMVYFSNYHRVKFLDIPGEEGIGRAREFLQKLREHQAKVKADRETAKLTGTP